MKKRILSLLIMLFMIVSIVLIANNKPTESDVRPISISDILEPISIEEIEVEPLSPYEVARENMKMELAEIESIKDKKEWFLAYKNIIFKYAEWTDPPETIFDEFSEDEIRLICQMVETECYQQDFDSKCNVIAVVMNRFYSGNFGDTITEVITSENQFAYGRKNISEDTILAVQYVFEADYTAQGALYFHSNEKTDTFCGANYLFSDNAIHHFYK